ncbi:flagellar associated protein [Cystoisospora suis]|uniref:Flagellar associated protein n=1 Tax=Cystoisospora suis TaxID=483139 RepID=A0A2C6KWF0_9APIC|nr:flagellar associated protein [Cystoisospora suis]
MPPKAKKDAGNKSAGSSAAKAVKAAPTADKQQLQDYATSTLSLAKHQKRKVVASWLPVMREVKVRSRRSAERLPLFFAYAVLREERDGGSLPGGSPSELRKDVDDYIKSRELQAERKDAFLEMKDLDLDDAEEQDKVVVLAHKLNTKKLAALQEARIESLEQDFKENLAHLERHFEDDIGHINRAHGSFKQELELIVEQIENEEKLRAHDERTEHNTHYELIRNRNIEADHQMKSALEEQIDRLKERCDTALQNYRASTDANAQEYKKLLQQDATLSKQVDLKLKQVERLQAAITHWKAKLAQNKQECEARNGQLKGEIDQLRRHCKELKAKMTRARHRLVDLSKNSRECKKKLTEQLKIADRILRTAELCRKYETEREKVAPVPESCGCTVDDVDWNQDVLGDDGIDEWNYLDNFFKRYNRVLLDKAAFERQRKAVEEQVTMLDTRLTNFVDSVSINKDTLDRPNTLLLINSTSVPSQPLTADADKVSLSAVK